uniref:Uncharacterized protein n=1 Tax=Callorhinchus milii TaxID=7868 RepID=A0A4W3KBP1_CALMI
MDVQTSGMFGKKLSAVSEIDLWIDKAEILLELGFYQPVRLLLAEAHKAAKELGNKEAEGRSLYLLAALANRELNFGQAQHLLEEAYKIGGNEYYWYNMIACMIEATVGKKPQDYHELASNFLKQGIAMYQDVLVEKPNRIPVLKFMIASLEARLTIIEVEAINSSSGFNLNKDQNMESLISACDQLHQSSQTLIQFGYKQEAVGFMVEHVKIRRTLAKYSEDEEPKHSHLLAAYELMEKAIIIEEDIFRDVMSLLPLTEVATLSMPVMEKLANLKITFAELVLDMLQLVTIQEKKEAEAERKKKLMQTTIEEFIRSTPDYTPIEEEWVTISKVLGQNALLQLLSSSLLKSGSSEIKTKSFFLTGKCLRWLAVRLDPIHFGNIWVQHMKVDVKDNRGHLSHHIDEENEEAEEKYDDLPVSTQQLAKCVAKAKQLKYERSLSQMYLAQASEVLIQSINWAQLHKYTEQIAAASLEMVECFGQFDPVSAGHYLALHQSCRASVMLKNVLMKVGCNTSSSQLAALTNLQQQLSERGKNNILLKTVNERLETCFQAWQNIAIHPQHLSLFNEFPSNFNIIILQHSEDRTLLYGALLEKPKSAGQKVRSSQGNQSQTQAKIVRASVDPTLFSHLVKRFHKHKQNLAHYFVKCNATKASETIEANKSRLLANFSNISESLEEYLKPVLSQFDFSIFGQPIYKTDKTKRSKNKNPEMKSASEKSLQDNPASGGEYIILLPDNLLLELPLETLRFLQKHEITSVSRDFSLQFLYNRFHRGVPEELEGKKSPKAKEKQKKKRNW